VINWHPASSSRYAAHEKKRKAESVSSAGSGVPFGEERAEGGDN